MKKSNLTRRNFLLSTASLAFSAGCASGQNRIVSRNTTLAKSGYHSPNEKLNIAAIGIGGKGESDVMHCSSENIVALCDVDWNMGANSFKRFPNAKKYKDFRLMLEEMPEIDAVVIATPDHIHAVAAMRAMSLGKHVYVQKPLTHSVHEARILREAAHQYGVATQMGNNGAASDFHRETIELYMDGAVGQVREVYSWTDRPTGWWPQGIDHFLAEQKVPDYLDWELWQGESPKRAYNEGYCPFKWRGWWDYGTGALGDIACHNLSPVAKALRLGYPESVECTHIKGANEFTYPEETIIHYHFPQRGELAAVDLYWYDGKLKPPVSEEWEYQDTPITAETNGNILAGDSGMIVMNKREKKNLLIKDGKLTDQYKAPIVIPRLPNIPATNNSERQDEDQMHKIDWILSCKTGSETGSNFDHAGVLTEFVLLGNIAIRYPHQKLLWDGERFQFTNHPEANQWIRKEYPKGWELVT